MNSENLVEIREVATYFGCSTAGIRKWIRERNFPFIKLAGILRFRPSEIEVWVSKGERKAA
jgi:excisionase family DNA binding protein